MKKNFKAQAIIFDMDGVLIDSEPLWRQAEMECFAEVGVELDEADCASTMGQRIDKVVDHWFEKKPWQGCSCEELANRIVARVMALVSEKGQAMPGVMETLETFSKQGIPMAVASSSWMQMIRHVMEALELGHYFDVLHSAEDEQQGKPHPAVYLGAARRLGVSPDKCMAIEDSCSGLESAKRAGMYTVAVPDEFNKTNDCYQNADICIEKINAIIPFVNPVGT